MHPHCRSLISHQPRSTSSDIWVLHIRTDYRHRFRYLLRIINILIVHLCRHTLHNFRLVVMLSPLNNSITSIVSMLTEFNLPGNCTVYCHYQHISIYDYSDSYPSLHIFLSGQIFLFSSYILLFFFHLLNSHYLNSNSDLLSLSIYGFHIYHNWWLMWQHTCDNTKI